MQAGETPHSVEFLCVTAHVTPHFFFSDCGPLLDPVNGSVNISSGTTFSKKAFYSCDSGFRVTGGNIRICTADGWSGMAPVCAVTGNRMEHSLLVVDMA